MQHLEFLAEMGGMQELQQGKLFLAEPGGFRAADRGDQFGGMMDEKRLLRLDGWSGEAALSECLGQPVPAYMTGEILLTRASEEVVGLGVAVVSARCAGRGGFGEFTP